MSAESVIAEKYAQALLLLAQEGNCLKEVQSDLKLVAEIFGQGEGRELLVHPRLSLEQKQNTIKSLVEGKVGVLTLALLRLLIEKRRGVLVAEIAAAYAVEMRKWQGWQKATVTTALPFSEDQMQVLRERLATIIGTKVELSQVEDLTLRGGARITMGDLVLDGSLGARLLKLRQALSAEQAQDN